MKKILLQISIVLLLISIYGGGIALPLYYAEPSKHPNYEKLFKKEVKQQKWIFLFSFIGGAGVALLIMSFVIKEPKSDTQDNAEKTEKKE